MIASNLLLVDEVRLSALVVVWGCCCVMFLNVDLTPPPSPLSQIMRAGMSSLKGDQ